MTAVWGKCRVRHKLYKSTLLAGFAGSTGDFAVGHQGVMMISIIDDLEPLTKRGVV